MKYTTYMMVLAVAASVSATAHAQSPGSTGPIARVLTHRAELSLDAEQVRKLVAIDGKYAQKDRELIAQIESLRGNPIGVPLRMRDLPAAEREKLQASRAQLQPLMQQLRTSHTAAISEMQAVLTAEQNNRARAYVNGAPRNGSGPGAGQGAGRGGQRAGQRGMGSRTGR